MVVQPNGCTAIWLYNQMAVQPNGCTTKWLYSHVAVQPYFLIKVFPLFLQKKMFSPFFFGEKMCFSIFGRFLMELGLLVARIAVSKPRSPRIIVQTVKIRCFNPFYEVILTLSVFPLEYGI